MGSTAWRRRPVFRRRSGITCCSLTVVVDELVVCEPSGWTVVVVVVVEPSGLLVVVVELWEPLVVVDEPEDDESVEEAGAELVELVVVVDDDWSELETAWPGAESDGDEEELAVLVD